MPHISRCWNTEKGACSGSFVGSYHLPKMTENDENDAFRDSLNSFASYPRNLVHHNTFDHILEGHVDRLDKQDERLFSSEERTDVELWESGNQPSGKVPRKWLEICNFMLKSSRVFVFPFQ